jgi:hypothetical protein
MDVRVSIDGKQVASSLDGKALVVDPGTHTFRYEPKDGAAVEERVSIRTGEKNRRLVVTFGAQAKITPVPVTTSTPPPSRPIPPLFWVGSAFAVAGFAVFAGVGGSSLADESKLRSTCAPNCAESDVHAIRVKHTVADIGLSVGIVSVVVAAVVFFTRPTAQAPSSSALSTRFLPASPTPARLEWTF